jgi:ankyrin repeat protein
VRKRPHFASLFAISVILASVVNLAIIYFVTSRPRAVIHATVESARTSGMPVAMPRPRMSLDEALRRGDVGIVKQHMYWCLKEHTCDLDKELRIAAESNNPTIAKVLIAAGAKVNSKTGAEQETPLHSAATVGQTGVAEVLLSAGAEVNVRDEDGRTPLHAAAAWGHVELTRLLLAAGANANATDKNGQTPLHFVAKRSVPPLAVYADVARMLLDAGAKANARSSQGATPLRLAMSSASRLSLEGNLKATADANEVVGLLRERGGRN